MIKQEINPNYIQKIKKQKASIGHLNFKYKEDQNFSKWYSLTENLIIKSFGVKSNQLTQLQFIKNRMYSSGDLDFQMTRKFDGEEAKNKFKDLLENYIEELSLDLNNEVKLNSRQGKSISIKMNNTQTVNNIIDVSIEMKNIINNIKQNEPDAEKSKEAENKLKELETEIKSGSPTWSKIKDILIWLLNFSRDVFLQVLPIIMQTYKK